MIQQIIEAAQATNGKFLVSQDIETFIALEDRAKAMSVVKLRYTDMALFQGNGWDIVMKIDPAFLENVSNYKLDC